MVVIELALMGSWAELRSRARVRACARYGVLVVGEEMKGSRTLFPGVRRPAAESRSRLGAVGIAMAHCLSGLETSAYLFRPLLQDGR
jgi:hypothetical protein